MPSYRSTDVTKVFDLCIFELPRGSPTSSINVEFTPSGCGSRSRALRKREHERRKRSVSPPKHVRAEPNRQCQSVLKWAFKDGRGGRGARGRESDAGVAAPFSFLLFGRLRIGAHIPPHHPSIHLSILHPSFQRVEFGKSGAEKGRDPCISAEIEESPLDPRAAARALETGARRGPNQTRPRSREKEKSSEEGCSGSLEIGSGWGRDSER